MKLRILALLVFIGVGTLVARDAQAQIDLSYPKSRGGIGRIVGPCGRAGSTRVAANVTTLTSGSTITVKWREVVVNAGHYRISIDEYGSDSFVNPKNFKIQNPAVYPVLADGMCPHEAVPAAGDRTPECKNFPDFEAKIKLPDVSCDNCTLQLLKVRTDVIKDPFYYQCADLKLTGGPPTTMGPADGGTPDAAGGSGGKADGGGAGGTAGTGGSAGGGGTGGGTGGTGGGGAAGGSGGKGGTGGSGTGGTGGKADGGAAKKDAAVTPPPEESGTSGGCLIGAHGQSGIITPLFLFGLVAFLIQRKPRR